VVSEAHRSWLAAAIDDHVAAGVDPALARTIAGLPHLLAACDIVGVTPGGDAEAPEEEPLIEAARAYFALDSALDLPWLKACVQAAPRRDRWDRLALTGLEDDLSRVLRGLTSTALSANAAGTDPAAAASVGVWLDSNLQGLTRYRALMRELQQTPAPELAMLTVAVRTLGELLPRGRAM
jgi:NAD-specific glutamate dehydrogenase